MYRATQDKPLATTITGSLPRPSWFVSNLSGRSFLATFARDPVYREQYGDAVAALIADQTRAGLDILSDGELRRGSWLTHMADAVEGFVREKRPEATTSVVVSAVGIDGVWKVRATPSRATRYAG